MINEKLSTLLATQAVPAFELRICKSQVTEANREKARTVITGAVADDRSAKMGVRQGSS